MTKMTRSEAGKLGGAASLKYHAEKHRLIVEAYDACPKLCKQCSGKISYDKRRNDFCSRSCSATHNNRGLQRNPPKRNLQKKPCLFCGKITKNEKCCSRRCAGSLKRKICHDKIRRGEYTVVWSGNEAVKNFLIEERGELCEVCKRTEWQGEKIPLTVHHEDGDATNNLPENLKLICWNCHGLTRNFGRKNKKSTRTYRYRGQSGEALAW